MSFPWFLIISIASLMFLLYLNMFNSVTLSITGLV
nr:MAG TPA: hypothetical protein [Caudoviricetes sp.]